MNAFLILVLLLTVAYIMYYGIVVSQDIIAARKSGESAVETIDVSSMSEGHVKTVEVRETPQGFRIGEEETRISLTKSGDAVPATTLATTPETTVETTLETTVETTVATTPVTTGQPGADIAEVREKMEPPVQQFSIEQSMTDYSLMLEDTGASCELGMYRPKAGSPVIVSFITPEASAPVAPADESENVLEDNSQKDTHDRI